MESLLEFGLATTRWLQSSFPTLALFMAIVSDLNFIAFLLPVVYWGIDKRAGRYLVTIAAFSGLLNDIAKFSFRGPRPFWLDPTVDLSYSPGYGVPSGHTQSTFVVLISLAQWLRRTWFWVFALFFALLMGISRIYLGTHFVHDVIGAYLLGSIALLAGWQWQSWGRARVKVLSFTQQVMLIGGITAVFGLAILFTRLLNSLPDLSLPWGSFLTIAERESLEGMISGLGSISSVSLGFLLESHYVRFRVAGTPLQRIVRILFGLVLTGIFFFGLGLLFPDKPPRLGFILRFIRFFVSGFLVSFVVPLLFIKLGLATSASD